MVRKSVRAADQPEKLAFGGDPKPRGLRCEATTIHTLQKTCKLAQAKNAGRPKIRQVAYRIPQKVSHTSHINTALAGNLKDLLAELGATCKVFLHMLRKFIALYT
jgi:hypothetical protein